MDDIRFLVYDPGHFHAALVFKEMYHGASDTFHVYAPLGSDLLAFLQHLEGFNTRPKKPTSWNLQVYAGCNPLDRMLQERPGNAVILSGRNRGKMQTIRECLAAGLHVLADKPWILSLDDLDTLRQSLDLAEQKELVALDIMTERHEITTILQRELVQDPDVFGTIQPGTPEEPAVSLESLHSIKKKVAGNPLRRPATFFDVEQQGEGLTDVGTHLVDLVLWILFPGQPVDAFLDLNLNSAKRWQTTVDLEDFSEVTGLSAFPDYLKRQVRGPMLNYYCNNSLSCRIRGIHVNLTACWNMQSPDGTDSHFATFRGTRAIVEVRQGGTAKPRTHQLYVRPYHEEDLPDLRKAVKRRCKMLDNHYRNLELHEEGSELRISIPDRYRSGHEAHFGVVTRQFLDYVMGRQRLPGWEKANMLAKYRLTTAGVHLARGGI